MASYSPGCAFLSSDLRLSPKLIDLDWLWKGEAPPDVSDAIGSCRGSGVDAFYFVNALYIT